MPSNTLRRANIRLWIAQSVLAALFLFAGVMKLVVPAEQLAAQSPLPVLVLRHILDRWHRGFLRWRHCP